MMKNKENKRKKKNNSPELKRNKGITLIALVITIIVLLILAGVTIATLTGENGIISKATEAKEKTKRMEEKEAISLAVISIKMDNETYSMNIGKEKLEKALKDQLGNNIEFTITDNGDGSFIIEFDNSSRMYYVESTGNIIDKDNMLKISTADELKAFRDEVNSGNTFEGKYIYLANNITLDINEEWIPIGIYLNDSETPDDEDNIPFKGVFDGKGYEINGIYINTTDKAQGFIGFVENGSVLNLGIGENNNITGGKATAGVVGYLYNGSTVSNCYNKSDINTYFGGGIVGCAYTNTVISNCYNTGTIIGQENGVGGIAGMNLTGAKIKECYNTGKIENQDCDSGGITGHNSENSAIEKSYNLGKITGSSMVGGIAGINNVSSIVNECYNKGDVESTNSDESVNCNIGGIVGFNDGNRGNGVVINCYNKGIVKGNTNNTGGIIGLNRASLKNSYNIGEIEESGSNLGGIVGNNDKFIYNSQELIGIIENSYCIESDLLDICGENTGTISEECSEKTSTELKGLALILGDSFKEDAENINEGYPIFSWQ